MVDRLTAAAGGDINVARGQPSVSPEVQSAHQAVSRRVGRTTTGVRFWNAEASAASKWRPPMKSEYPHPETTPPPSAAWQRRGGRGLPRVRVPEPPDDPSVKEISCRLVGAGPLRADRAHGDRAGGAQPAPVLSASVRSEASPESADGAVSQPVAVPRGLSSECFERVGDDRVADSVDGHAQRIIRARDGGDRRFQTSPGPRRRGRPCGVDVAGAVDADAQCCGRARQRA